MRKKFGLPKLAVFREHSPVRFGLISLKNSRLIGA